MILHGIQSHGGWYQGLGRLLAESGYETHFLDRRGSGANRADRGYTPSASRLVDDIAEYLRGLKSREPALPVALVGISWGGKLAVLTAGRHPELVDILALIAPGIHPRVGVPRLERLRIAWAFFTNRRKTFPIPLSDPALFTANPTGQAFIANDPLGLRAGTAALLAASRFIDRSVRRIPSRVSQAALLMLAGHDRIVDNGRTLKYFQTLASPEKRVIEYPEGHHTLEFDPDPSRYALDLAAWLDRVLRPEGPRRWEARRWSIACQDRSNRTEEPRRSAVDQDKKRELRQLKREIKRVGGKHRRRQLKQGLIEHPEEAHEDEPDHGPVPSSELNGLDRPADGDDRSTIPHRLSSLLDRLHLGLLQPLKAASRSRSRSNLG